MRAYACPRAVTRFPVTWPGATSWSATTTAATRNSRRSCRAGAEQQVDRFDDGAIDLLSIDATQSAAFADQLDAWLPKLSPRAVILVYGIDDPSTNNSALELWTTLSERYRHFEFVQGAGLGVLGVGKDLPPALQHLFSLDAIAPRALEVREMFARLGGGAGLQAELGDLRRRLNAALDSDQVAKLEIRARARPRMRSPPRASTT